MVRPRRTLVAPWHGAGAEYRASARTQVTGPSKPFALSRFRRRGGQVAREMEPHGDNRISGLFGPHQVAPPQNEPTEPIDPAESPAPVLRRRLRPRRFVVLAPVLLAAFVFALAHRTHGSDPVAPQPGPSVAGRPSAPKPLRDPLQPRHAGIKPRRAGATPKRRPRAHIGMPARPRPGVAPVIPAAPAPAEAPPLVPIPTPTEVRPRPAPVPPPTSPNDDEFF